MKGGMSYRLLLACIFVFPLILLNGCGNEGEEHAGHDHDAEAEQDEHGHEAGGHEDEEHEGEEVVKLSAKAAKMIELRLASAERRSISRKLLVGGEISRDFEKSFHVSAEVPGVITKLKAAMGDDVCQGSLLAVMKSSVDGKIREIRSPGGCEVITVNVAEGEEVDAITSLFTVADLHKLKASFDIYECDLSLVRKGQKVAVETAAYAGVKYMGVVKYISPRVDEHTRTIKIRVDVENPDHTLKLGMFVTGTIDYTSNAEYLTVLNAAMIEMYGKTVVFVPSHQDENEYEMRELKLGRVGEEYTQVLAGLSENEAYVARGAFELKAELVTSSLGAHAGHGH